jgi:hypothetical protein
VDPRAGLDDVEKKKFLTQPGLELRPLGRPARSQSLFRMRYPGSQYTIRIALKITASITSTLNNKAFSLFSYISQ